MNSVGKVAVIENAREFQKTIRGHIAAGICVLLLVGLTVTISLMEMERRQATVLILAVAGIQVFIVAQFLMHLIGEDRPVYAIVGATVFFVAALIALSVIAFHDTYEGAYTNVRGPFSQTAGEEP